jgi:hypothetical protein
MKPNQYQAAVARAYAGGDFAHIADSPTWREDIKTCGDTLFRFLMLELDEDVTKDPRLGISRLASATGQLVNAMEVLMATIHAEESAAQSQGDGSAG